MAHAGYVLENMEGGITERARRVRLSMEVCETTPLAVHHNISTIVLVNRYVRHVEFRVEAV